MADNRFITKDNLDNYSQGVNEALTKAKTYINQKFTSLGGENNTSTVAQNATAIKIINETLEAQAGTNANISERVIALENSVGEKAEGDASDDTLYQRIQTNKENIEVIKNGFKPQQWVAFGILSSYAGNAKNLLGEEAILNPTDTNGFLRLTKITSQLYSLNIDCCIRNSDIQNFISVESIYKLLSAVGAPQIQFSTDFPYGTCIYTSELNFSNVNGRITGMGYYIYDADTGTGSISLTRLQQDSDVEDQKTWAFRPWRNNDHSLQGKTVHLEFYVIPTTGS